MKISKRKPYDFSESRERIDRILDGYIKAERDASDIKKEKNKLSQKTGAYVYGTVLVITFYVKSEVELINQLKIYRAFSSEVIAILTANENCEDIYTYGNKIIAIYNTSLKKHLEKAVDNAASICSLSDVINKKTKNSGYPEIKVSTALDSGNMLMMRFSTYDARENDNKLVDEVQYITPLIGRAEMLCNRGFEAVKSRIYISNTVFNNLSLAYQKFFNCLDDQGTCYGSDIVNVQMNNWLFK